MTPPEPGWHGAQMAELSWTDGIPRSTHFQDTYFSRAGGAAESRYVFLAGNDLPARWAACERFTIAETGFGTGLNFLATWQAWRESGATGHLHFVSIEGFPLARADMATAAGSCGELASLAAELLGAYPPPLPGMHRLLFDNGRVCLDLVFADLSAALDMLAEQPDLAVDAWFLDGFAPARNPDMWTGKLFTTMSRLGSGGTSFATFTAAGDVRRGLQTAGFRVEKLPGFGGKREMLRGRLQEPAGRPQSAVTPWHLPSHEYGDRGPRPGRAPGAALVVGAGLAGAATANALARRGVPVTVLDRGPVAGGASGNEQGALYTRISHRASALNDFSLHSFCFATRFYQELLLSGALEKGLDGELCGALHLRPDWGPDDVLYETVASLPGLVRGVGPGDAAELAGIPCNGGLFYPESGWLHPPAVCRAFLQHPGITVRDNCGPIALERQGEHWLALDTSGAELARAAVAVIACGTASAKVADAGWLQLQKIRGQTSQLRSGGQLAQLKCVICHEGYLPPARAGEHCLGATFDIDDEETGLREEDHSSNLIQASRSLPALAPDLQPAQVNGGRVGVRCASPDYLPIVGPVPDAGQFCKDYEGLRRNARKLIPVTGSYQPGLYVSTGHGSRGLTSTPLAGELLASQVCGEPWPLPAPLVRALSPARFLVRELSRNRR